MNIKEFDEYIVEKYEKRPYSRNVSQDKDVVKDLMAQDLGDNWEELKNYLYHKYNNTYHLDSISSKGLKPNGIYSLKEYNLSQRCVGTQYKIKFRGIEIMFYCNEYGTIEKADLWYILFTKWGNRNFDNIPLYDTFQEMYAYIIDLIIKSKREAMTHYNSEIRGIKQEYKRELQRHNEILKLNNKKEEIK